MFCTNCGAKIQEGTSFCANCGYKVLKNNNISNIQIQNNNKQQGQGASIASMVLGIIGIIASIITFFIAISYSTYVHNYNGFGNYYSIIHKDEMITIAVLIVFLPALLSIISFGLAIGSRSKNKGGANTTGLILSIITIILCVIQFLMIVN